MNKHNDEEKETTVNLHDEIYLLSKGKKLASQTAEVLAQTPQYRMLNSRIRLPATTLVNLLSLATMKEVTSINDLEHNIAKRFNHELHNFVKRNPTTVNREAMEYVAADISGRLSKAHKSWTDFIANTQALASVPSNNDDVASVVDQPRARSRKHNEKMPATADKEILALMKKKVCSICSKTGYLGVRYSDDKNVRILYSGVIHHGAENKRGMQFHREKKITDPVQARGIAFSINQKRIPSPLSRQDHVTGFMVNENDVEMPELMSRKQRTENKQ